VNFPTIARHSSKGKDRGLSEKSPTTLPAPLAAHAAIAYAAVRQDHCHLLNQRAKRILARKSRIPDGS
jgi:hypothetical protein